MPTRAEQLSMLPLFGEEEWWVGMTQPAFIRWLNGHPSIAAQSSDWHKARPGEEDCGPHQWRGGGTRIMTRAGRVANIRDLEDEHLQHCWRLAQLEAKHVSKVGALWVELMRREIEPVRYMPGETLTELRARGSVLPPPPPPPTPEEEDPFAAISDEALPHQAPPPPLAHATTFVPMGRPLGMSGRRNRIFERDEAATLPPSLVLEEENEEWWSGEPPVL